MTNKFLTRELFVYIFFFTILSVVLYYRQLFIGLHYDDSFITYRYAINFSDGKGFVFNEGERVNSASSLLFTLILALFHYIGFTNLQIASSVIGLLSSFASIYLVYNIISGFVNDKLLKANILIPFVFSGNIIAWAASGMESLFFIFLILLFFKFYIKNNIFGSTLLLCLLLICRAESVILFGSVLLAELFLAINKKNYVTLLSFLLFGGSTIALFLLWNFLYFDSVIPQPLRFKSISSYYDRDIAVSFKETLKFYFFKNSILTVLSLAAIVYFLTNILRSKIKFTNNKLVFTLSVYLLISVGSFMVGPYSDFNRYMIHTIPIMSILAAIFIGQNYESMVKFKYLHLAALLISISIVIKENRSISNYFLASSVHQEKRILVGKFINSKINNQDLIYSSDLGAISYFAINNKFVDLLGLTSSTPFNFIETSQNVSYIHWLKYHKIVWVADTELNGKIQCLEILKEPSYYFNTIQRNSDYSLDLYDKSNKFILKEPIGGDMNIVLMRLNENSYLR